MTSDIWITARRDVPVRQVLCPVALPHATTREDGMDRLRHQASLVGANAVIGLRAALAYSDPHFQDETLYLSGLAVRL